jgi:flagellar protein FlaG
VGGKGTNSVRPSPASAEAGETDRPEKAAPVEKVQEPLSKEQMEQIRQELQELNQEFRRYGVEMKMEPQEGLDPAIVRVHDAGTGELIRQIPAKEWVVLRRNLAEGRGLILDRKV